MRKEKKVFILENKKLSSMGPDYIVYIPRALVKHKVLDPEKVYNIHFEEVETENKEEN